MIQHDIIKPQHNLFDFLLLPAQYQFITCSSSMYDKLLSLSINKIILIKLEPVDRIYDSV